MSIIIVKSIAEIILIQSNRSSLDYSLLMGIIKNLY